MVDIIDGKLCADKIIEQLAVEVANLKSQFDIVPGLAVIIVGDNPASKVYVKNKVIKTKAVGMNSYEYNLPADISQQQLISKIDELNNDKSVNGILVQLPLPDHIDESSVINNIDPAKDVDGFHVTNSGLLATGQSALVPCTPQGCLILLKEYQADLSGLKALIVGRSNIVGKPMASLLLQENCTTTIAHSKTKDIVAECQQADIVVAAIGKANFIQGDWLKKGSIVIDVGINRVENKDGNGKAKLIGDVDFASAKSKVKAITPVPGGVGPMTIACLLKNTVKAAKMQN
ncbi:MAG: bifunctional methylenetetrahydrofolate dehydrogenase/methenyltetrahydrofolate cyclohydrolase FolD [Pseudomonadota bacterium]